MACILNETLSGYPILEINHPAVLGRVALHGAQLLDWTPTGKAPVLYLSPQAVYSAGKAIRGGIPICWPWFGPHPSDFTLPAHGFARTQLWTLSANTEDDSGVHLKFTLTDTGETRRLWPHTFHLELEMDLGASLRLALQMTNSSPEPLALSAALHSYFNTADISQTSVSGLHGVAYQEKNNTSPDQIQEGDIIFDREVDRLYASGATVQIHDAVQPRLITIESSGSRSTVVWNPWSQKSKRLSDLPDEAYRHFLCVETTNAGSDTLTLLPSATHCLATTVHLA